jgi:hypothetical protein
VKPLCHRLVTALLLVSVAHAVGTAAEKPKDGFVPDESTAIKIAVAVWEPIYGRERIEQQKPYRAYLTDGIWTVTGTLDEDDAEFGGVAYAEIAKADGRIIRVFHEE